MLRGHHTNSKLFNISRLINERLFEEILDYMLYFRMRSKILFVFYSKANLYAHHVGFSANSYHSVLAFSFLSSSIVAFDNTCLTLLIFIFSQQEP